MLDATTWEPSPFFAGQPLDSDEVLVLLTALQEQSANPVVRECLRCVRDEIAFLTTTEGGDLAVEESPPPIMQVVFHEE